MMKNFFAAVTLMLMATTQTKALLHASGNYSGENEATDRIFPSDVNMTEVASSDAQLPPTDFLVLTSAATTAECDDYDVTFRYRLPDTMAPLSPELTYRFYWGIGAINREPLCSFVVFKPNSPSADGLIYQTVHIRGCLGEFDASLWQTVPYESIPMQMVITYRDGTKCGTDTVYWSLSEKREVGRATPVKVVSGTPSAIVSRHDASGRQLPEPRRGINIVRYADGSIEKVYVR